MEKGKTWKYNPLTPENVSAAITRELEHMPLNADTVSWACYFLDYAESTGDAAVMGKVIREVTRYLMRSSVWHYNPTRKSKPITDWEKGILAQLSLKREGLRITSDKIISYLNELAIHARREDLLVQTLDNIDLGRYNEILDGVIFEIGLRYAKGIHVCGDCLDLVSKLQMLFPCFLDSGEEKSV